MNEKMQKFYAEVAEIEAEIKQSGMTYAQLRKEMDWRGEPTSRGGKLIKKADMINTLAHLIHSDRRCIADATARKKEKTMNEKVRKAILKAMQEADPDGHWSDEQHVEVRGSVLSREEVLDTLTNWAQGEVEADIREGYVPELVCNFAELHDYVDANYYGLAFKALEALDVNEDDPADAAIREEFMEVYNDLQTRLNEWLGSRLAARPATDFVGPNAKPEDVYLAMPSREVADQAMVVLANSDKDEVACAFWYRDGNKIHIEGSLLSVMMVGNLLRNHKINFEF